MGRPQRDEWLLEMARVVAQRGTCSKWQVGCVVARDGRVLVTGYNGAPAGAPHCDHICTCWRTWNPVPGEPEHSDNCRSVGGCPDSVHAEANAIAYAARYGISLQDATIYSTLSVCLPCAQLVVNAGIKRAIALDWYKNNNGLILLNSLGIDMLVVNPAGEGYKG